MITAKRPMPPWLQAIAEPAPSFRFSAPPPRPMEPPARKRVLLVAYSFPPVGGAGVQRPAKWVKYLQQFGWDVTVLTVENPSVPLLDESLLQEIPASVPIIKARTLEPGYRLKQAMIGSTSPATNATASQSQPTSHKPGIFQRMVARLLSFAKRCAKQCATTLLQPDAQRLWLPGAWKVACQALEETPHDALLVTAPPYSSFLLGQRLARKYHLPLILDYRDEWDLSSKYLENSPGGWYARFTQQRMQQAVLKSASAVIATTNASSAALRGQLKSLGLDTPIETIYNGFDTTDFASVSAPESSSSTTDRQPALPSASADRFRLVYTGTLWNLTDIQPVVRALELVCSHSPEIASNIELTVIGRKTPEQSQLLTRLAGLPCQIISRDYCPHAEVLGYQSQADSLLLLLSDVPGAERVVPAKLFEYLATRKQILAVVPPGETAEIVQTFHARSHFPPGDPQAIANWLIEQVRLKATSSSPEKSSFPEEELLAYSRSRQTAQLAKLLSDVCAMQGSQGLQRARGAV